MKREFGDERIKIGYSGHETGIEPSLAAIALGAEMVERHFALSRRSFVHHIECSLEPDEYQRMVAIARSVKDLTPYIEEAAERSARRQFRHVLNRERLSRRSSVRTEVPRRPCQVRG